MPIWGWILIVIAAVVVLAVVVWQVTAQRRTSGLRRRFGPEYDRVAADRSKRDAESELAEREERREQLEIRPLPEASRTKYHELWRDVQARFVDDPRGALTSAEALLREAMAERGYPVTDFEQRAADVSVDHPEVVENFREGHRLAQASTSDGDATEDLRQAMQHYRALFEELVEAVPEHSAA